MKLSRKAFLTILTLGAFVKAVCTPVMAFPFKWNLQYDDGDDKLEEIKPEESKCTVYNMPGTRWNFNGKWNPSKEYMEKHLKEFHKVDLDLSKFSKDELKKIHNNVHNGYLPLGNKGGQGSPPKRTYNYKSRTPWFRRR
jgi:hypothetical protein